MPRGVSNHFVDFGFWNFFKIIYTMIIKITSVPSFGVQLGLEGNIGPSFSRIQYKSI